MKLSKKLLLLLTSLIIIIKLFFNNKKKREYSSFISNETRNGTLSGNDETQWDFFGSVFYCVTLVSTIGYGHITCKTKLGKVFTIVYSAIG